MRFRTSIIVAITVGTVLFTGACSTGEPTKPSATGGHNRHGASATPSAAVHNQADITFAQSMIPHHRQAVEMADLAPTHGAGPAVSTLAKQIKAAQGPEITAMSGWLKSWGKPVPGAGANAGGGHAGHGGGGSEEMAGMMSKQQMDQLMAARGAAFDRAFLTMMIAHHQGAVQMAKTEQAQGKFPAAKTMAAAVIRTQQAEITTMRNLLG